MWTPGSQAQLVFRPITPTQEGVDNTYLGAQPDISCQDAGLTWRTTGVTHFKILIFKDALFYKQYTCNIFKGGIKDNRMNSKSPELSALSWLFHIYLFFQDILTHRQTCKCSPLLKIGKGLWEYFLFFSILIECLLYAGS